MISFGHKNNKYSMHQFILNKKLLPQQWQELIIARIYKKGDKADCTNYRGISVLPTTYKMLPKILLPRLTPYVDEITGDWR
jgi:hypothetical protein